MTYYLLNVLIVATICAIIVIVMHALASWDNGKYPKSLLLIGGATAFTLAGIEGAIAYPVMMVLPKWFSAMIWLPPLVGLYTIFVPSHMLVVRLEPMFGYARS